MLPPLPCQQRVLLSYRPSVDSGCIGVIKAQAELTYLIQGKMGIVSCPTLSSDYFCLKYFGFVYDQSLQWKSSLDSVRHWSSNFFYYETSCLQCFLFGKQNNGTKTKVGLS